MYIFFGNVTVFQEIKQKTEFSPQLTCTVNWKILPQSEMLPSKFYENWLRASLVVAWRLTSLK